MNEIYIIPGILRENDLLHAKESFYLSLERVLNIVLSNKINAYWNTNSSSIVDISQKYLKSTVTKYLFTVEERNLQLLQTIKNLTISQLNIYDGDKTELFSSISYFLKNKDLWMYYYEPRILRDYEYFFQEILKLETENKDALKSLVRNNKIVFYSKNEIRQKTPIADLIRKQYFMELAVHYFEFRKLLGADKIFVPSSKIRMF